MPYREAIPDSVRDKINSWNLSPSMLRALWETLRDEIRTCSESDMRRIVAPIRCLILRTSVNDSSTGERRDFALYIDPWIRSGERTLIDAIDLSAKFVQQAQSEEEAEHPIRPEFR
jgi:hypothetical protein